MYRRLLGKWRPGILQQLCETPASITLQDKVRALILTLIGPLAISKEQQKKLTRWIPGLIAEVHPGSVGITPRHCREKHNLLAMQLCHAYPFHFTEEEKTLRLGHDLGLMFAAGEAANGADGPSLSVLSNNHQVLGLSFEQLVHMLINHFRGLGDIQSLSATVIELAAGRRQRERKRRIDAGLLAAQEILSVAQARLVVKTLAERSVEALQRGLVVFCDLCVCVCCVCVYVFVVWVWVGAAPICGRF
jgi:hypothetical protein